MSDGTIKQARELQGRRGGYRVEIYGGREAIG